MSESTQELVLQADIRTVRGKEKIAKLRQAGRLPGNVYGKGIEGSIMLEFDRNQVTKDFQKVTKDTKLILEVAGKRYNVVVKELQRHTLTRRLQHLDLMSV